VATEAAMFGDGGAKLSMLHCSSRATFSRTTMRCMSHARCEISDALAKTRVVLFAADKICHFAIFRLVWELTMRGVRWR
jgi:hypothetical protein